MPGPAKKEAIRLLPSELNLLPPGDKAAPGALELQNWRTDQAGVLRSRRGHYVEASGFSGPFHTLFRWANDRYGLTGSNLHKGTGMASFLAGGFSGQPCTMFAYQDLVWIMDRSNPSKSDGTVVREWSVDNPETAPTAAAGGSATVQVATFDAGESWEVIANDGQIDKWIIERTREQISSEGTVSVVDGSTTVTGIGTAFDVSMVGKNIAIYNGNQSNYSVIDSVTDATHLEIIAPIVGDGAGLTYEITRDESTVTETKQFDAENKTEGGHSLRMVCSPGGRWSARLKGILRDTRIAGAVRGDDQFRFQFYTSDPGNVTKVTVTMITGSGGERDYRSAEIPGSAISQARYTWQELSVSRGTGQAGPFGDAVYLELNRLYDIAIAEENHAQAAVLLQQMTERNQVLRSQRVAFEGSPGFDWTAITEIQIDVELTDAADVQLDDAYFIGGIDASLEGEFSYAVSFTNIWGHETSIGPYSAAVSLNKQSAAVTNIPVSADPQVNLKHVYRIGGGVNAPLRVTTLGAGVTNWTDIVSVEEQQRNGVQAQLEVDPAPAAWGAIQHGGRVIAWAGNRLYWSEIAKPWSFPGSGDPDEGNWVDVGNDGDDIVTCTSHGNQLRIFKRKSIWRVLGDPDADGSDPEQSAAAFGALGIRAVVDAGHLDYFVAGEGVFSFDGDTARKISLPVDPVFKGDYPSLTLTSLRTPASAGTLASAAIGYVNGRLYVSYPEEGQSTPNRTLILDVESGRWFDDSRGFRALNHEGQGNGMYGGTEDGRLLLLENGLLDGVASIPLRWRTAYLDQGLPDNLKRYSDLVIEFQTAFGGETPAATLNLSLALDNGATVIALGSLTSSTRTTVTVTPPLGTEWVGRNFSVLIEGGTQKTCLIYAAYLHYEVLPRRVCAYDSGTIDLGSRMVKRIEAVEFDVDAAADTSLSLRFSSDLPGNAIAQRYAVAQAVTAGRRTVTVAIPTGTLVEGRRHRMQYTASPACPQLYGLRVRYRMDGEYIEPGQLWTSPVVDLGEMNLFYAVEVVMDSTGPVNLFFTTELPGFDLTVKHSLAVDTATTTGRVEVPVILPHGTRGKLFAVNLTPNSSTMRLYGVRVFARNFHRASGGGGWRWIPLFTEPDGEQTRWQDVEVQG